MFISKLRDLALDVIIRVGDDEYPRYINPAIRDQLIYLFRQYLAGYVSKKKLIKYLSKDIRLPNLDIIELMQRLHEIKEEETIKFSTLDVESNNRVKKAKRHKKRRKGGRSWIRSQRSLLRTFKWREFR